MADTERVVECPACSKTMGKVLISEKGFNLDVCLEGCGGIFFDNREFRAFDQGQADAGEIKKVLEGKTFKKADQSEERFCPACGAKMVKNVSPKDSIEVDDCYTCGGKFLDSEELFKIRQERQDEDAYMSLLMSIIEDEQK